jgi:hypothetical protein
MVDHVWTLEPFRLTISKVWPRSFAWLCTLLQSSREFYKEQTLFKSQVMKRCGECSKRAHKSEFGLFPTLSNFKTPISVSSTLAFRVLRNSLSNLSWSKNKSWSGHSGEEHVKVWHQFDLVSTINLNSCSLLSNHWHWQIWSQLSPNLLP